jgi:hypothetical protein
MKFPEWLDFQITMAAVAGLAAVAVLYFSKRVRDARLLAALRPGTVGRLGRVTEAMGPGKLLGFVMIGEAGAPAMSADGSAIAAGSAVEIVDLVVGNRWEYDARFIVKRVMA